MVSAINIYLSDSLLILGNTYQYLINVDSNSFFPEIIVGKWFSTFSKNHYDGLWEEEFFRLYTIYDNVCENKIMKLSWRCCVYNSISLISGFVPFFFNKQF